MLSFVNTTLSKETLLTRVRGHIAADNLIRGVGWENGKGCAVGCSFEYYDHERAERDTNVPEWLWRLEDTLFEGMSAEKAKTWPDIFASALPEGWTAAEFEKKIKAPFLIAVLKSTLETFDNAAFTDVTAAINRSILLWQRNDIGSPEFLKEAAWAAAWAARAAAGAAAWAARAAAAAAAWAARAGAWAAAWAAAAEAGAAAWAARAGAAAWAARAGAKYDYFADELVRIMKDAA